MNRRLYKYAVDLFVEMLNQVQKRTKPYRCNDPDDYYVNGMTIDELKAIKQKDFDANPRRLYDTLDSSGKLITTPDVINISVMLKTNDELVTPTISRVVMSYI